MKTSRLTAILAISVFLLRTVYAQDVTEANHEIRKSRENIITRAVAESSPAIAGISATQIREVVTRPFPRDPVWSMLFPDKVFRQKVQSLGSGFLVSEDGYVLTNAHVIEYAADVLVTLSNGKEYEAEIVGADPVTDIAVIKLKGDGYKYLQLGDSDEILLGEWVIALGNPFGLFNYSKKPVVTVGVVSGVNLDFGKQRSGAIYEDMIQTDASINSGNSGGPLLNAIGEVIGINTFIFTGNRFSEGSIGIGFAIPINRAKEVMVELKEQGVVDRSFWTGLHVQSLNPLLSKHFELNTDRGVRITDIDKDSPAELAGLKIQDIILAVNGEDVYDDKDILRIIEENFLRAGDIMELTIRRGDRRKTVYMTLGKAK